MLFGDGIHCNAVAIQFGKQICWQRLRKTSVSLQVQSCQSKAMRMVQTMNLISGKTVLISYAPLLSSPFHKCQLSPPQTLWRLPQFWQWPRHSWLHYLEGLWGSRSVECLWRRVGAWPPLWLAEDWVTVGLARRVQVQELEEVFQVSSQAGSIETQRKKQ